MTDGAGSRVVVIALDSLDSSVFEQLLGSGALPNLARFARATKRATVRSDGDTLHGSVWPTFATGTCAGTHGVYFWTQWLEEEMGYVHNSHAAFGYEPFWGRIAAAGHPVTVIDVPYVPLTPHPNVVQVSDWGTHDDVKAGSWPPDYGSAFQKRFGKHPLEPDTGEPLSLKDKAAMVRTMRRGVALRSAALEQVLRDRPGAGFHLMVYGETHKAGHYLAAPEQLASDMDNVGAVRHMLEPLDQAWPRILDAAGPEATVMVIALHGMMEQVDYSGSLGNQVLAMALGKPAAVGVQKADLVRRLRDLLPLPVHRAVWRRLPRRFRASRLGSLSSAGIDFEQDALFRVVHDGHLALRKNVRGRERDGRFSNEESEGSLGRLADLAGEFTTVDGRPAFGPVWRPREAFGDRRRIHRLPDALLLANPEVTRATTLRGPDGVELTTTEPEVRNGFHTGRGFVYLRGGAGGTAEFAHTEIKNQDFAPSLLSLFGRTPPGHFEGSNFFQ